MLNNWEARSKYLLHDIIKYQNYCDVLEKSLAAHQQQQLEEQQQQSILLAEAEVAVTPLVLKSTEVDLFKEINQELFLSL